MRSVWDLPVVLPAGFTLTQKKARRLAVTIFYKVGSAGRIGVRLLAGFYGTT
jgi:hypothetical protein